MATDVWKSYWYICHKCDASIEVVSKVESKKYPSCPCGARSKKMTLCQMREMESVSNGSL